MPLASINFFESLCWLSLTYVDIQFLFVKQSYKNNETEPNQKKVKRKLIMMMIYFCGMVDWQNAVSFISRSDHSQSFSPFRASGTPSTESIMRYSIKLFIGDNCYTKSQRSYNTIKHHLTFKIILPAEKHQSIYEKGQKCFSAIFCLACFLWNVKVTQPDKYTILRVSANGSH